MTLFQIKHSPSANPIKVARSTYKEFIRNFQRRYEGRSFRVTTHYLELPNRVVVTKVLHVLP